MSNAVTLKNDKRKEPRTWIVVLAFHDMPADADSISMERFMHGALGSLHETVEYKIQEIYISKERKTKHGK